MKILIRNDWNRPNLFIKSIYEADLVETHQNEFRIEMIYSKQ